MLLNQKPLNSVSLNGGGIITVNQTLTTTAISSIVSCFKKISKTIIAVSSSASNLGIIKVKLQTLTTSINNIVNITKRVNLLLMINKIVIINVIRFIKLTLNNTIISTFNIFVYTLTVAITAADRSSVYAPVKRRVLNILRIRKVSSTNKDTINRKDENG